MRTLERPSTDEAGLYGELHSKRLRRDAEGARVLMEARQTVLSAYNSYSEGEVWKLSSAIADESMADRLRANYRVLRNGALKGSGAEILARSSLCCLCGLRDTSELDHYLPKEDFPEFSALSVNLIPVCGVCNKKKGRQYQSATGGPKFVHAYHDELPDSLRYLRAHISVGAEVEIAFEVVRPAAMSAALFNVIEGQFEYFKLNTAFGNASIELLCDKMLSIGEYFEEGESDAVKVYLDRDSRSAANRVGWNHWKPAILSAAAMSSDFCEGGFNLLRS